MLTLLYGPDRLSNSQALLERICARAAAGQGGNVLIVPEQYSHETERALCRTGGDRISRYAEVLSFTRLAGRVASMYGGVCEEYLDEGGRLLTMYLAAQQVLPQLKYYASAAAKPAFLQQLAAAVEEFLSYCLEPQALFEAARRSEGQFAQKLQELGLLYESYLSICKTGRNDPVTRLYALNDQLFEHPYAAGKTFYLDGFSDFTAIQTQILATLLPQADVVAALQTDGSALPVYATAAQTMQALKKLAARLHVPVETERAAQRPLRRPDTEAWNERLFARNAGPYADDAPDIAVHRSDTAAEECAFAAAWVRRLVQLGARYREITVAVTDPDASLPMLRSVFARAGIPAYLAGTTPLLLDGAVSALRTALAAAERYDYEPVMNYLKSPLCPLTREAVDRLERYAHLWDLHGMAWERELTFHPRGYGARWEEDDRAALAMLESWRAAAIGPLAQLRQRLRQAQTAAEQVESAAAFLEQAELGPALAAQSERLRAEGQPQRAQQTEQIYEALMQALEQFWQVAGRQAMPPEQFAALLDILLGCYQVGTIPAKADEVQIGPLPAMRHRQTEYLLLLGAEEGKFPAFGQSEGLLSDEERRRLLSLGLSVAPAQEARLERELGWIHTALSAVTGQVVLSTGGGQASYLLERTEKLFPRHRVLTDADYPYLPDAPASAAAYVRQEQMALLDAHPVLLQAAHGLDTRSRFDFSPLETQTVRGLYGAQIQLSVSRIDLFSSCKYAYFLRYGLKSEPWKQAKFDAPAFGTFVHYVLEQTVRAVMAQGGFQAVSGPALRVLAERYIEEYAASFLPDLERRGSRFTYLFTRSRREVLEIVEDVGRELARSDFRPVDMELSFARGGALPPVEIEGSLGRSQITGFVDRVDLYETADAAYYRVVDYKTGRKDFDYASILQGEGLQMLIYLFALRKYGPARYGKPLIPAGVLYVPGRADMERIDPGEDPARAQAMRQKKKRRKGLVLDDAAVLQAMEHGDTPEYLPVQVKKDGLSGDLASREQLWLLERFLDGTLRGMTDEMLSGAVEPDPLIRGPMLSPCRCCEFRTACHQDLCAQKRRYISAVGAEQFWDEVERRVDRGGHTD